MQELWQAGPTANLSDASSISGTNYTAGLEIVRTSPDHGTAMHLAGKGKADATSMRNALYTAIDVYHARKGYDEMTKDPLKKQREKS